MLLARATLVLACALALGAVTLVALHTPASFGGVELEVSNPYGAYSTNIANTDPLSLGYNDAEYLNSQQQQPGGDAPLWTQAQTRLAQQKQTKRSLEDADEDQMLKEEDTRAAEATAAIRSDIERAKLDAARKRAFDRQNGILDGSKAPKSARSDYPPLYSAAQVARAIAKRREEARLRTDEQLKQTFMQLAAAVGSAPAPEKKVKKARKSPIMRVALREGDEDEGEGDKTMHRSMLRMLGKKEAERMHQLHQERRQRQQEERRQAASENNTRRRRRMSAAEYQLQAQERAKLMSEARRRAQKQSLAVVAKETGEDARDVAPEWHTFTAVLGMHPKRHAVSSRAQKAVDELIGNDLI